jgi:hypothetical protein
MEEDDYGWQRMEGLTDGCRDGQSAEERDRWLQQCQMYVPRYKGGSRGLLPVLPECIHKTM